ncbi:MAG: AMP-binding protein, partial [Granulosicoccaceae bacterium]
MSNHLFDALLAERQNDDRPFMLFADGGSWSYAQALTLSAKMAAVLVNHGIQPGDRVAVQVEKSPQAMALYFACLRSGAVLLPLNTAYTATELAYFIGDAEPAVVIVDSRGASAIAEIAGAATVLTLDADGGETLPVYNPACPNERVGEVVQ